MNHIYISDPKIDKETRARRLASLARAKQARKVKVKVKAKK